MLEATIRPAVSRDAEAIAAMLFRLAEHTGDDTIHRTDADTILRHGFGEPRQFTALLAERPGAPLGLSLFFPMFSTTRGKPGVYVQDLWVEQSARGSGLGTRLLEATAQHAAECWSAGFLKLTVHSHNEDADAFYRRLGFENDPNERPLLVDGEAFQHMKETP